MKKVIVLCMFLILVLGCQSKEKTVEEKPKEPEKVVETKRPDFSNVEGEKAPIKYLDSTKDLEKKVNVVASITETQKNIIIITKKSLKSIITMMHLLLVK